MRSPIRPLRTGEKESEKIRDEVKDYGNTPHLRTAEDQKKMKEEILTTVDNTRGRQAPLM